MAKWLRTWLIGFVVYVSIHWLGSTLLGIDHHGPFHSLLALAFGAFAFGGVLSWLQAVGKRPKLPEDQDTGAGKPAV